MARDGGSANRRGLRPSPDACRAGRNGPRTTRTGEWFVASRTSCSTRSSSGGCARWASSTTMTTGPRAARPWRSASSPERISATRYRRRSRDSSPSPSASPSRATICFVRPPGNSHARAPRGSVPTRSGGASGAAPRSPAGGSGRAGANVDVLLEWARPPGRTLVVLREAREELLDHAALADPRLAEQRDQVPAASLVRALERVEQQTELALAVHERDRPARRRRARAPGPARLGRVSSNPFASTSRLLAVLDLVAREEPRRRSGTSTVPGLGRLLQPRREVHRRPRTTGPGSAASEPIATGPVLIPTRT